MKRDFIYLDHNATTRPADEVIACFDEHVRSGFANPGSRHAAGRRARRVLEDARESMAHILGADPDEIIFTSGGTESSNLAILGLAGSRPGLLLLTEGEHPATLETCRTLRMRGWEIRTLPVDEQGLLLPIDEAAIPWEDVRIASVILAHNETGVIQKTSPLAELCARKGIPLHLDAVQAVGKIPVNFRELNATALSLGAHKFQGIRGVGALLVKSGQPLTPQQFGGHQEAGRRPGTEAVPLIAAMVRALELWDKNQSGRMAFMSQLRDHLEAGLWSACAPVVVNGSTTQRLPNTLNISFPGLDGEALLVALDLAGIGCSLGSTCASGSAEPAPALVAMRCAPEVIRSAVRFSVGMDNTPAEIEDAIERISQVVQNLRATQCD